MVGARSKHGTLTVEKKEAVGVTSEIACRLCYEQERLTDLLHEREKHEQNQEPAHAWVL